MQIFKTVEAMQQALSEWRQVGERLAFVPTMGNLHEGHLSLIDKASEVGERVIVSIYVNPMQFGAGEDFETYPRTIEADIEALQDTVDGLFLPSSDMIYPDAPENSTRVVVPHLSDILCGEHRPGHFTGVTTVVCKLLNLVSPDFLVLGEKDFQQVAVIRRMAQDLFFAVEIVTGATIREADGLAKSSRNQYLALEERQLAPTLYETLCEAAERAKNGEELSEIESLMTQKLNNVGFRCDYFEFRNAETLNKASPSDKQLVILAAAYLGNTRLIDNITVTLR